LLVTWGRSESPCGRTLCEPLVAAQYSNTGTEEGKTAHSILGPESTQRWGNGSRDGKGQTRELGFDPA
jgi:hypothetical protein